MIEQRCISKKYKFSSRTRLKWRAIILTGLILFLLVGSLFASQLTPNDPYATDATAVRQAPGGQYPLGTDIYGRCVLSRVIMGARTSIFATLTLIIVTGIIGTAIGMLCGYYGGLIDNFIMRLGDVFLSVPQMVLAIAVAGILGGGMINAMLALGFANWILYARLAKSATASLIQEDFIRAAKLSGCSDIRIMFVHILPNIAGPLAVNATIQMGSTLIGFAGLSFLGLGVQAPKAEWGSMISEARGYLQLAPWAVLSPGIAIIATTMLFNLYGDTVRDLLEVKDR